MSSHVFDPSVGGIEAVGEMLSGEFAALGHEVRVVTQTDEAGKKMFPFEVIRRPHLCRLFQLLIWCDVYLQNNISLNTIWPALMLQKPCVVTLQTWTVQPDGAVGWRERLKQFAMSFTSRVAISIAVAKRVQGESTIIGNPYCNDVFNVSNTGPRCEECVFVGRLVSDKGVDLLLKALVALRERELYPRLTIIGEGPEEPRLRGRVDELALSAQVRFGGVKCGVELAQVMNAHEILVVPSMWAEPFGIVALEGIACGCVVVGSEEGGLKDTIGPCGLTFQNGDAAALARVIERVILCPVLKQSFRAGAASHLKRFSVRRVAESYLRLFEGVVQ